MLPLPLMLTCGAAFQDGLIGYWPLDGDCRDHSGHGLDGINTGANLNAPGPSGKQKAARFNGRDSIIEIPQGAGLQLGRNNFSITAWVHSDSALDDTLGDILSKYDPAQRRGVQLGIANFAGVTSAQSNHRHLYFGIDTGTEPKWTDCGRPGNNLMVWALAAYAGHLYAGTFETGKDEAGHVYRYVRGQVWEDCGSPDHPNAVTSLAVYQDRLYAATGRYRSTGSSLPASENDHLGGHVYRYEGDRNWADCGKLGDAEAIFGMVVFRDQLYASDMYSPGLYRYDAGTQWTYCGNPGGRVAALTVFNGALYGTGYDAHNSGVYRYEGGKQWTNCGTPPDTAQTYSFAMHEGSMYVGTWPTGTVFRYEGDGNWANCGRLGEEKEVMAMAVYNGKLYAGTLPLAEIYRFDGGTSWTRVGRIDFTPDVVYRRAWSMALFQGKLFCGTLPSGRVFSMEAGHCVTCDDELRSGWRHVAAVRKGGTLRLYVDGQQMATATGSNALDIGNDQPLRLGFGTHDYFNGSLCEVRWYNRALSEGEVATLLRVP